MSHHINGIVQITRRINQLDRTLAMEYVPSRESAVRDFEALLAQREDLVLAAIRDGIDPDLMTWAIGQQRTSAADAEPVAA
jgi:hypothetical protein